MDNLCIYYDEASEDIIDILPTNISPVVRSTIEGIWKQHIPRKIMILLSGVESTTAPGIKKEIGHSMSTLHENIKRLESEGLISSEMVYTGNKQRVIRSNVLCVTKNPKHKERMRRFFQGMWVDSKKTKQIIDFLRANPKKYYSAEDISVHTKIPVDEVVLLLSNWDSIFTKGTSMLLKEVPFEKKILYRGK